MKKEKWLQGELNPGLLACLAEALPLDQGVNLILAEKKSFEYDLWSQQIFVKILLTQETSTMCLNWVEPPKKRPGLATIKVQPIQIEEVLEHLDSIGSQASQTKDHPFFAIFCYYLDYNFLNFLFRHMKLRIRFIPFYPPTSFL